MIPPSSISISRQTTAWAKPVAILTTGYSAGQILGPLVVTPLLRHGYHQSLLIGAGVVLVAALAAAALRVRFPERA